MVQRYKPGSFVLGIGIPSAHFHAGRSLPVIISLHQLFSFERFLGLKQDSNSAIKTLQHLKDAFKRALTTSGLSFFLEAQTKNHRRADQITFDLPNENI